MQEELIEKLINIEEDARKLKAEAEDEIDKLEQKYQERMSREERVRIREAQNKGEKLLGDTVEEAVKYANRVKKESEREIGENEERYSKIKDSLLNKYFKIITGNKGV
ncbi:hypothetical protein GM661_08995 [Iocasia frigidifontis]|uniref:Uncharacterized protein n=1 Tax=Iocasia fonsfrigidae TaxID=2682810 RepID=A0A8A7KJR1_9FIRM|nr:hypothetical protein [Iocasia fonsfrigidae]QTL98102.1 hypothetical protein GM661_08995 [Iocasia fonsfrigidae]